MLSPEIREFEPQDIVINERQAKYIFYFFYPEHKDKIAPLTINDSDRGAAQSLIVDACEKSVGMGYFKLGYLAAIGDSGTPLLAELGKELRTQVLNQIAIITIGKVRQFIRGEKPSYSEPIRIYNIIRNKVRLRCREYFDNRFGVTIEQE